MTVTSTRQRPATTSDPVTARSGVHRELSTAGPSFGRLRAVSVRLATVPVKTTNTIGRALFMAAAVIRYIVRDVISLRLPAGEIVHQCWSLYKVTALPAVFMAIPFGGMVAVQSSG